ncbi:unnamed protein product [Miscanthus lutarioriparius]|uniref:AB hydrolase-1 domain-containing protein n=1 Tax=Miscanthus lutarioriparius TaxID=422564 RepID=A0A811RJT9_9POAL|nr:unnamed protein product [Miscanthus lutarioriparius]
MRCPFFMVVTSCLCGLCSCFFDDKRKPNQEKPPIAATTASADDQTAIITHRTVELSTGVRLHLAEAGPPSSSGASTVLLLHGFPELWYTWRHQMRALAAAGYHAVAPDLCGYGDSDAPTVAYPGQYTALHVVGDLEALIDDVLAGGEKKKQVFVAAHDWGALIAWSLCLFRPDRVRARRAQHRLHTPERRAEARRWAQGALRLFRSWIVSVCFSLFSLT